MRATIVDLRYRMKDVLGALDRGETVTVLYRGKEKATLAPIASPESSSENIVKTADQPLFGLWKDRSDMTDPGTYLRTLRQNRMLLTSTPASPLKQTRKRARDL